MIHHHISKGLVEDNVLLTLTKAEEEYFSQLHS